MNKKELKEFEPILLEHCYNMTILKTNALQKKKDTIINELIAPIVRSGLSLQDINDCIEDVMEDKVLDLTFFEKGGNLFNDYVNEKWIDFAKNLFKQRSIGLGTPNEASGEGELMFLFLSRYTTKPTKGDIKIDDEIIELKGEQVRVFGDIRGQDFRIKTLKIAKKFGLMPNKANKTNLDAVEVEKSQHLSHWNIELSKLSIDKQKEFIEEWLECLDNKKHKEPIKNIFLGGDFSHNNFIKEIIKILYADTLERNKFNKFVYLGDGTNSVILSDNLKEFNKLVDEEKIVYDANYFRINQSQPVGLYIKFSN